MTFRLDEFFRVSQDATLPNGEVVVVRVLSDIELQGRQAHSLGAMADMLHRLRNLDSDEYKVRIAPLQNASKQQLINLLITDAREEWKRQAVDNFPVKFFPFPDKSTDSEKAKILEQQREHELDILKLRAKFLMDNELALRKKYEDTEQALLVKTATERAVNVYAIDAGLQSETHYTLWSAVETPDGHKRWETPEVVANLGERVIAFLIRKYQEVDSQNPWELTKSEPERDSSGLGADDSGRSSDDEPVVGT